MKKTERINPREGAYRDSVLIEKIRVSKKIAFLDIDSTLTGNPAVVAEIRAELERQGCAVVFVTSRTEEMIMSHEDMSATNPIELKRPAPHLGVGATGLRHYVDPEFWPPQAPFVRGDAIAGSTGTRIFMRQKGGGYRLDAGFESQMKAEPEAWRAGVAELIEYIGSEFQANVSAINREGNYDRLAVDVYPPNYRVTLEFFNHAQEHRSTGSTAEGSEVTPEEAAALLAQKRFFQERVEALRLDSKTPPHMKQIIDNLRIVDDSNPDKGLYVLYLTPAQGGKDFAVDQILNRAVAETGIERGELQVILAGDSYPDAAMGLTSALGTKATFILPGGSRLSEVFTNLEVTEFAGEDFTGIKENLSGDFENGILDFAQSSDESRKVIVCEKAFPGMSAPESVLVALKAAFAKQ